MAANRKHLQTGRRKRKADLEAPECKPNCQVAHTIEEAAALMSCSVAVVKRMISRGLLPFVPCGIGLQRKTRRIPHSAIRALETRVA